ncbi:MAG: hypothetical protein OXU45_09375, partial [Candidatus Melainabacteria bacterium]|nr:hypothetical protein [Candidatus Melainabacteria bacterium]
RSQRSLAEVGLNQGGQISGLVVPTTVRQADYTQNTDIGYHASLSTRDSEAFANFLASGSSTTTNLGSVRSAFGASRDILSGSQADAVGDGQA